MAAARAKSSVESQAARLAAFTSRVVRVALYSSTLVSSACSNSWPLCTMFYRGCTGAVAGARRRSIAEPDFSTPIDSGNTLDTSAQLFPPKPSSLDHVEVCPDSWSLEDGVISQEWFSKVMQPVISDLNKYGVCVVDNFLGLERAEQILKEVGTLHSRGVFRDGQVVSRHVQDQARGMIRGDKITWVTGSEPNCSNIGQLVTAVDSLVAKANKHQDAGKLAHYNITWRTRAMVACYPGQGAHYVKHIDNPNGDGRCITAIYYVNKHWTSQDGGVLRIYPEGCSDKVAEIEPLFDRMLFFWSDRRNPHEVLPAKITSRYAITVWYLDQKEREEYLARVNNASANT
nr:egl nine homolog 1-like isoform X3 [Cherax quadricarinatus]